MNSSNLIATVSVLVPVIVALISKGGWFSRKHTSLLKDIELYNALPDTSKAKSKLLKMIDGNVTSFIDNETMKRRSGSDITIATIIIVPSAYFAWYCWSRGGVWVLGLVFAGLLLSVGVFGFVQGVRKLERDDKGTPIQ